MRINLEVLKDLDLSTAARTVTGGHLDRFPPLIMDSCLSAQGGPLVPTLISEFSAGTAAQTETLTMPRRDFSPRPVTIMSPVARTVYTALVGRLSDSLAAARTNDVWLDFRNFPAPAGRDDPEAYLVEFDIAACYEYIEHARLREELLTRTMDLPRVEAVMALLTEIHPKGRGLPQLSPTSDRLADTYLEVLERSLLRSSEHVARVADDFKVYTKTWGAATGVIERAAEQARDLGLILSGDKTHIWKQSTLLERQKDDDAFLNKYFTEATRALTSVDLLWQGDYDVQVVEVPPAAEELIREALRRILVDWTAGQPEEMPRHAQLLTAALVHLQQADDRLPDTTLAELVFRIPLRLEAVCGYVMSRPESEENWRTLSLLAAMERQSPWAKLWLLHVAEQERNGGSLRRDFDNWASKQLSDRHEVVRSQAAWYLARSSRSELSEAWLANLYREASSLTRPAIAAACGAFGLAADSGLGRAVKADSRLAGAAFAYGENAP